MDSDLEEGEIKEEEDITSEEDDNYSIISLEIVGKPLPEIVTIDSSAESEEEDEELQLEELQLRKLALGSLLRLSDEKVVSKESGRDHEEDDNATKNSSEDDEPYSPYDEEDSTSNLLQNNLIGQVGLQQEQQVMTMEQGTTTISQSKSTRHGQGLSTNSILKEQNLLAKSQTDLDSTPLKLCDNSSKENSASFVQRFGLSNFEQFSSSSSSGVTGTIPRIPTNLPNYNQLLFPNPLFLPQIMARGDVDMRLPMTNFITNNSNNNNSNTMLTSNQSNSMGPSVVTTVLPPPSSSSILVFPEQVNTATTTIPSRQPFGLDPLPTVLNPFNPTSNYFSVNACFNSANNNNNNFASTMTNGGGLFPNSTIMSQSNLSTTISNNNNPTLFPRPPTFNYTYNSETTNQSINPWTSFPVSLPPAFSPSLTSTSKEDQVKYPDLPILISSIPEAKSQPPMPPPLPSETLLPPPPPPPPLPPMSSKNFLEEIDSPDEMTIPNSSIKSSNPTIIPSSPRTEEEIRARMEQTVMDDEISCVLEKILSRAKGNSTTSSNNNNQVHKNNSNKSSVSRETEKKSVKRDSKDDKRHHHLNSSKSLKPASVEHVDKSKISHDSSKSSSSAKDKKSRRCQKKQSSRVDDSRSSTKSSSRTVRRKRTSQNRRKQSSTSTSVAIKDSERSVPTNSTSTPAPSPTNSENLLSKRPSVTISTDNNTSDKISQEQLVSKQLPSTEQSVILSTTKPPESSTPTTSDDVDGDETNTFEDEEVLRARLLLDISRKNKDTPSLQLPEPTVSPPVVVSSSSSTSYHNHNLYMKAVQQRSKLSAILRKKMIPSSSSVTLSQYPYVKDNTQLNNKTIINNSSSQHRQIIRVVDRNRLTTTTMSLNNLLPSSTTNDNNNPITTTRSPNLHSIQRTIINTNYPYYNSNSDPLLNHLRKSVVNQNVTPLIIRINRDESSSDEADTDAKTSAEKENNLHNKPENLENKTVEMKKKDEQQRKTVQRTIQQQQKQQHEKDYCESNSSSSTNPNFFLPHDFELSLSHLLKSSRDQQPTVVPKTNTTTTSSNVVPLTDPPEMQQEEESLKEIGNATSHINDIDLTTDHQNPTATETEESPPAAVPTINHEVNAAKEREELYLREKLLKATLLQKMKDSKDRLILRKLENDLLSSRRRINQELNTLLTDMMKMSDLKNLYQKEQEKVNTLTSIMKDLRRQLSVAVKKANSTAESLDSEEKKRKALTSVVFSLRKDCVQLVKECREQGCKVEGSNYKVPSAESLEMKSKLVEVRKQNVVLRSSMEKISPKKVIGSANLYSTSKRYGSGASATLAAANRVKKFFYSRKGKRVRLNSEISNGVLSSKYKPSTPRQVRWQINRRVQGKRVGESNNKAKKNCWLTKYGKSWDDEENDNDQEEVFLLPKMLFKDVMTRFDTEKSSFTCSAYESPLDSIREYRERYVH